MAHCLGQRPHRGGKRRLVSRPGRPPDWEGHPAQEDPDMHAHASRIECRQGDIARQDDIEAVVNAANAR
ncbi:hypothetical protein [Halomonas halophila]|uniref:hypothetical protein n=1 Tax=Halomonas halophila TaxID=29573 RepID=UPI003638C357